MFYYDVEGENGDGDRQRETIEANKEELIESLEAFVDESKQKTVQKDETERLVDEFYVRLGWGETLGSQTFEDKLKRERRRFDCLRVPTEEANTDIVERALDKSTLHAGLEGLVSLPEYDVGDRRAKAARKKQREKTKGPGWFDMPAPEITPEIQDDLQILKMRSTLDPKHFYKKNDMEMLPKYFQIGKVIDSPLDHTNVRLTKKERKKTLVDELLADAEFNKYNKKKYKEIMEEKRKNTYKTYIKDKRIKNKKLYNKKKKSGTKSDKKA